MTQAYTSPSTLATHSPMQEDAPMLHPAIWPYLILLTALTVGWLGLMYLGWKPSKLFLGHDKLTVRLAWAFLPPLLVTAAAFSVHDGFKAFAYRNWVKEQEVKANARQVELQAQTAKDARQFALEVLGLGLTVENWRQTTVWTEMKKGSRYQYLLPEKEVVPSTVSPMHAIRASDAISYALDWFVEKWPIPTFLFGAQKPKDFDPEIYTKLLGVWHRFTYADSEFSASPTNFFDKIFEFFDRYPDVPAAAISGEDTLTERAANKVPGAPPLLPRHTYVHGKAMRTDTYVALAVGRKDRVDWLRPYATKAREGKRSKVTGLIEGRDVEDFTAGEWYEPDWVPETPDAPLLAAWNKPQAKPFTPTKWLPKPWRTGQLHQIDTLPVLGYIHRPVRISYLQPDGTGMNSHLRQAAFATGWAAALSTLQEGQYPTRILHNLGPSQMTASDHNPRGDYDVNRLPPLFLTLNQQQAPHPEPDDIDMFNLPILLGEMGAATPMAAVAIAVMASHAEGNPSAVVLFDRDGATLIMIAPPNEQERARRHPAGHAAFSGKQESSQFE